WHGSTAAVGTSESLSQFPREARPVAGTRPRGHVPRIRQTQRGHRKRFLGPCGLQSRGLTSSRKSHLAASSQTARRGLDSCRERKGLGQGRTERTRGGGRRGPPALQ